MDVFCETDTQCDWNHSLRKFGVVSPEKNPIPTLPLIRSALCPRSGIGSEPKLLAIAFDLDETIGSFSDFHSIWARLETHMKTQQTFNDIMELYPDFLRVDILSVFIYIRAKQESGHCLPIYIYTKNQCEAVNWIYQLIHYIEFKISPEAPYQLFARPICAFQIRGKQIEKSRTTHEKTYSDFVKCSRLTPSQELCFIDDVYYKKMKNRRVYYIQPPPYVHSVPYREVVDRFLKSDVYKRLYPNRPIPFTLYDNNSQSNSNAFNTSSKIQCDETERKITNRIMYYIREFFFISSKKCTTKKRRPKIGNYSRKKYIDKKFGAKT
jgi:hypothetical protein